MGEHNSSRQHSRREYLAALGATGVAAVGSTGVIAGRGRDDEQADVEGTLHPPPLGAPAPGSLYPRVTQLKRGSGKSSERQLLATFEYYSSMSGGSRPYFPVYRGIDGGETWSKFSEIHDTNGKDWGLRYQPTLFELPHVIGPWPTGMVLVAGNSIPILDDPEDVPEGEVGELDETSIDLYASTNHGESWEFVSTVVMGGKAVPYDGSSPVWEPELGLDDDGNLICYFADERMRGDDDYNQLITYKASEDGGQSWGDEQFAATIPDETTRPGVPTVTPLPNGTYVMSHEVIRPDYLYGEVRVETSPDGREWGGPMDVGTLVSTADGRRFINGPYVTWTRADGKDGTVLVSEKQLVDGNRDLAKGNGEVVLANSNPDGNDDWKVVDAPLSFETEGGLDGRAFVGWTTPLLPSRHGDELLQLTSVADGPNLYEISYGVQSLPLDDGT